MAISARKVTARQLGQVHPENHSVRSAEERAEILLLRLRRRGMPAPGAAHYGDSEETQSDCSSAAPISHFGFRSISFRIGHITLQRHLRLSGDRPIVCSRQEPLTLAADLQLGQLSPFLEIERRAVPAPGPDP